jgi:hypothetical protein
VAEQLVDCLKREANEDANEDVPAPGCVRARYVIAIDETADSRHGVGVFLLGIWLALDRRFYRPLIVKIDELH